MNIVELTADNLEEFRDLIADEYLENIPREYCSGLVGLGSDEYDLKAALFWEVKNVEREDFPNLAEIRWFFAEDAECADLILDAFITHIDQDDVAEARFEMIDLKTHEKEALEEHGFQIEETEGINVIVTLKDLEKLSFIEKAPPRYIKKIGDISTFQFKAGIMNSALHDRYGLLEDLPFLPMSWYEPDISSCVITDDKVTGLMLIHQVREGKHRVELLFSEKLDASINVLNMIRFSIRAGLKHYSSDDEIIICRHNNTVEELVKKLFPDLTGDTVMRGVLEL